MARSLLSACAAIGLLAACSSTTTTDDESLASAEIAPNALEARLDNYFAPLAEVREFSGVVMVANSDEVLAVRSYGLANAASGELHTPNSVVPIASVSKSFTGAAITMLATRGELLLDDPISRFLPDFPRANEITVRMLLLHQSGVGELHQSEDFDARRLEPITLAEQVERIGTLPFNFDPGSKSSYSNSGYILLARIAEIASGRPFEEYLKTEFLEPIGLKQTAINWNDEGIVPGYLPGRPPSMVQLAPREVHASHSLGASGMKSTVADLVDWARAVDRGTLVDFRTYTYPFGWGVREYHNRRAIEQSGISDGYVSGLLALVDDDIYVAMLGNIRAGLAQNRALKDVAGIVLGEQVEPLDLPEISFEGNAALGRYSGRYDFPGLGAIKIEQAGVLLQFEWESFALTSFLYPTEDGQFWNRVDGTVIGFEEGRNGQADAMIWGTGGNAVRAPRLDPLSD